jgi:hypothetical protein
MLVRRVRLGVVRACFAGGALLASACGYAKLSCAVSGREFMLIHSRTNLCAAATISSALLGSEVCVLADCLLGCVLSVVCCCCGVMHQSCCRLSMTDDQRFPAKCMSASCRSLYGVPPTVASPTLCALVRCSASSFLQGASMHPSTALHCISVWRCCCSEFIRTAWRVVM